MSLHLLLTDLRLVTVLVLLGASFGFVILTALMWAIRERAEALIPSVRVTRNIILPTATLLYLALFVAELPQTGVAIRFLESVFWVEVLWVVLMLTRAILISHRESSPWKARIPELFIDLVRFATIVVGSGMIIAGVWGKDFTGLLATLGVGSLVLGLALQDTLGNLMAGIALLFERPFQVGDWIRVADLEGQVSELNWRAVRMRTRDQDMVIVPNSILGKERIANFSRPTTLHATNLYVGFSYDDPPNKVKRILRQAALMSHGVRVDPSPVVRTKEYRDFYINYQVKIFLDDFASLPDIEEDFMTRVWYAARRNKLTIPYPIRSIYKTDVTPESAPQHGESIKKSIQAIPLFSSLSSEELASLAQDSVLLDFACGEKVVHQGDRGDSLYIIRQGEAAVSVTDSQGKGHEVARLRSGDFFGEMALLTGEPRSATVSATEDMQIVVVYKEALRAIMEHRPELARTLAKIMRDRQSALSHAPESNATASPTNAAAFNEEQTLSLAMRIKRFLAI
ncbi:MAG: mechanosensitive ion channel [Oligoflexia bacterium]|nr:mechanosensitive ion channel [Oligoflexia bacterium]